MDRIKYQSRYFHNLTLKKHKHKHKHRLHFNVSKKKNSNIKKISILVSSALLSSLTFAQNQSQLDSNAYYHGFHTVLQTLFGKIIPTNGNPSRKFSSEMRLNGFGFQLGMHIHSIRAEISTTEWGDVGTSSLLQAMIKGDYDFKLNNSLTVYPAAGLGVFYEYAQNPTITRLVWMIGAGTTFSLNNKTNLSAEYNYTRVRHNARDDYALYSVKDIGGNTITFSLNRCFG